MSEPQTRLIRVSTELLDSFGTRTADGRSMSAEWGEPTGHCPDGDEYIYEPTFTATDDGWLDGIRAQAAAAARAEVARVPPPLPATAAEGVLPPHEPGDHHQYQMSCTVCGQPGTVRLTLDPEREPYPALVDELRAEFDQGHFIPWEAVIARLASEPPAREDEPRLVSDREVLRPGR